MKKHLSQQGSAHVVIVVCLVLGLLTALGWIFYQNFIYQEPAKLGSELVVENGESSEPAEKKLASYIIDNEGLVFDYDPDLSVVKGSPAVSSEGNGAYVVKTEVATGDVVLSITTGIDGIGGTSACLDERESCKVISTKASTYLGEPVTYRLVEANLIGDCGGSGSNSCRKVPLTTTYLIDTSTSNEVFGPCCGTISSEAKNLGKKAETAGSVLVSISPSKGITNASLFKNSDLLETIKIIEALRYKHN